MVPPGLRKTSRSRILSADHGRARQSSERAPGTRRLTHKASNALSDRSCRSHAVVLPYVLLEYAQKFRNNCFTLERDTQLAVDVHRRPGILGSSGQRDSDIGVLRLSRSVHDTPHHGNLHLYHAGVLLAPRRHLFAQIGLNVLRHVLKERRRSAATSRTRRDLRIEALKLERLKNLLRDADLFGAIPAWTRCQRHTNRVSDSFREQDR